MPKDYAKNAAALLLFKGGKGKGKEDMDDEGEEESMEYGPELMQAYLDAAKSGNAKKAYDAFKDLVDQCHED